MPTMTSYKFGDPVLVPFPFTDQTTTKKRPAVVVSSEAYQKHRPDLILMAVTSQIEADTRLRRDDSARMEEGRPAQTFRYQASANHCREANGLEETRSTGGTGSRKTSKNLTNSSWLTSHQQRHFGYISARIKALSESQDVLGNLQREEFAPRFRIVSLYFDERLR